MAAGEESKDGGGGILTYLANRRRNHVAPPNLPAPEEASSSSGQDDAKKRRFRIDMTNIGGSFAGPLSIDSDSDDEDDSARLNLVPSSWLATWQKPAGTKLPQLPDISDRSSSLADSWASQVWSTVDSARSWVNASSSSSGSTSADNSWVSSSLSSAMKAVSAYNPFSGEEKVADAIEQQNNTSATRRRLSSNMFNLGKQLEAASKINPYQAVAGRDDIYLLSSPNAYTGNFFEFFSLTSWLTRIASGLRGSFLSIRDIEIKQRTSTESVRRKECQRIVKSKSMPSGASVEAVKNLLLLVQDQAELKVQENESNEQFDSSGFDDSAPSSPPPASNDGPVPLPLLSTPGASFDSERSGRINPRSSPVRTPSQAEADIDKSSSKELFSPVSSFRTIKAAGEAKGRNEWQNDEQSLNNATHVEMAARLAEGALRMYRDLALDEANELHAALHYWTVRWERPMLGWLEAGPNVWLSDNGYNPYYAGKKVSQIQAVLARRCAVVGEIQQHLWRANWRKGVADWGMLGNASGGQWSTVVGEFGSLAVKSSGSSSSAPSRQNSTNDRDTMKIFNHSSLIGSNVSNLPGGSIVIDTDSVVVWTIDAIRVIRDQLYRARSGTAELPFVEHWPREMRFFRGEESFEHDSDLPLWASVDGRGKVSITNLQQMAAEVEALLVDIETHLEQQRIRRLDRLRPPTRLRRNWYLIAFGLPSGAWMVYSLLRTHGGIDLMKMVYGKCRNIYREHIKDPMTSIYRELFTETGRINVADHKARIDAIESLKRMIRTWLDEYFPNMPEKEKISRAEAMDISLIETKFEESIKNIFEMNSIVRMGLIEMQFIKKEMLSAMVSMDELMGSNEMNMQVAAMTPALFLLMTLRRFFQVLFYALFKFGKSKEEIHAQFRQTMLDIERLLLMRDSPPGPPPSLSWGSKRDSHHDAPTKNISQTLSAEDLGMLLLHIHECRSILWQSRRRFRSVEIRNVAEDLAELSGERGPVSVSQQLMIISRMSRTYPFLKVVSSGIPFENLIPGG